MEKNETKEKDKLTIAYIQGIFEVFSLLNSDNHGRNFDLFELNLKNRPLIEAIRNSVFANSEGEVKFNHPGNFKSQIEDVYNLFYQTFLHKVGGFQIEEIKRLLNDEYLKSLLVNSILKFVQDASKIEEAKLTGVHQYGLPYRCYIIYKNHCYYILYFGITN